MWCLEPESNRHAAFQQAADFKSAVSTNFTIEAHRHCETKTKQPRQRGWRGCLTGGAHRSRTDLEGFAILCLTAWLARRNTKKKEAWASFYRPCRKKQQSCFSKFGAGKESRTLDLNLGKVALYQLSYSRVSSFELYRRFFGSTALRSALDATATRPGRLGAGDAQPSRAWSSARTDSTSKGGRCR